MTEREAISIMTAILLTAIRYDEEGAMLNDPREQMLDAMFFAEMIWNEATTRQVKRLATPTDLPA